MTTKVNMLMAGVLAAPQAASKAEVVARDPSQAPTADYLPKVLIGSEVVANAAAFVTFTNLDYTRYARFTIEYDDVLASANDVNLAIQLSQDNGATYVSTPNYAGGMIAKVSTAANVQTSFYQADGAFYLNMAGSNFGLRADTAPQGASGYVDLYNLGSVNFWKKAIGHMNLINAAVATSQDFLHITNAMVRVVGPVNAIRVYCSTGTITGRFRLYGIPALQ